MYIIFIWHWRKKIRPNNSGFAVLDSFLNSVGELSKEHRVFLYAIDDKTEERNIFCKEQNINYCFFSNLENLLSKISTQKPDLIVLNHHPKDYNYLRNECKKNNSKLLIYYSAPIEENLDVSNVDYHIVHHKYHKNQLIDIGISKDKIWISPKTANQKIFVPKKIEKKYDIIYPTRGGFGYWKRLELAVKACQIADLSIVFPGSSLDDANMSGVTVLPWLSPEELSVVYNQARCLLITSNEREMGPRVVTEATMCNLPFVVCSDSPAGVSYAQKLGGVIAKPKAKDIAKKLKLALKKENQDYRKKTFEAGLDYLHNTRILKEILFRMKKGM